MGKNKGPSKLPPKHLLYQQNRVYHDVSEQFQMQHEQCDQSDTVMFHINIKE